MRAGHAAVRRPTRVGTAAGGARRGGGERVEPRASLVARPSGQTPSRTTATCTASPDRVIHARP